jgi:NADPH2:quinone reductase
VPGKEGVGEVVEGTSLPAGARVYFMANAGYGADGAFAELVVVGEETAIEVPDGVDSETASCLGIAGLAGWLAVEWRAELKEGETVLVLGASGAVGQIAIQAARLCGAGRIVAAARDPEGLDRARALGAHEVVDLKGLDGPDAIAAAVRKAARGDVNVTVDPVWGDPALGAIGASAMGARLVQLGQSAGPEATLASSAIRGRMLSILGHTNFAAPPEVMRDTYARMCGHAAAGELTVELETFGLDDIGEAWERQAASPGRKLVITP